MQLHVFPLHYFTFLTKLTGQRFVSSLHERGQMTSTLLLINGFICYALHESMIYNVYRHAYMYLLYFYIHFTSFNIYFILKNEVIKYVKLKRFHFVCGFFFFKNLIPYSLHVFVCAANTVSFTKTNTSVH